MHMTDAYAEVLGGRWGGISFDGALTVWYKQRMNANIRSKNSHWSSIIYGRLIHRRAPLNTLSKTKLEFCVLSPEDTRQEIVFSKLLANTTTSN